jgi:MarR family transcriptional regulator, teicoplanin-associated locus regulator
MNNDLRSIYILFSEAMWEINAYVAKRMEEEEELAHFSKEQMETLRIIRKHPNISQGEIAKNQGVFKTAISNRIKKLEQSQLITIAADKDNRKRTVNLTNKGEALSLKAEDAVFGSLHQLFDEQFTEEEIKFFTAKLNKTVNILKEGKNDRT